LNSRDDQVGRPTLAIIAGNEKVRLQPGVSLQEGQWLEVWSGPSKEGPFSLVATTERLMESYVVVGAPNEELRCYRSRLRGEAQVGGWSNVVCATPRQDPTGPVVRELALEGGGLCAGTRLARLVISAEDDGTIQQFHNPRLVDPDAVSSGIASVRVREGAAWGPWRSYEGTLTVEMGSAREQTVWVQLRDHAGNEGETVSLGLRRCQDPGVQAAILLEEEALDALEAGRYPEAKARILASLPEIDREINTLIKHLAHPNHGKPWCIGQPEEVKALGQLSKIRLEKVLAAGLSKSTTSKVAISKLKAALLSEYQIAQNYRVNP
jgi:hypothetical protein